jgi:hypothetical protein
VVRHIFQACPVWIYTLRVTSQTSCAMFQDIQQPVAASGGMRTSN